MDSVMVFDKMLYVTLLLKVRTDISPTCVMALTLAFSQVLFEEGV